MNTETEPTFRGTLKAEECFLSFVLNTGFTWLLTESHPLPPPTCQTPAIPAFSRRVICPQPVTMSRSARGLGTGAAPTAGHLPSGSASPSVKEEAPSTVLQPDDPGHPHSTGFPGKTSASSAKIRPSHLPPRPAGTSGPLSCDVITEMFQKRLRFGPNREQWGDQSRETR